jgi:PiT family inorganic phosphate transporter
VDIIFYLSSGLFLGWSLGANDAANVFGTAVGSRMIRFGTAAAICSLFVALGAVESGAGAARGLGHLGAVNALPGAFTVAFSAALTVYWMTKAGLPVSITQAIVGAIVGWNFFSRSITDTNTLAEIVATWVACPFLGCLFAVAIYKTSASVLSRVKLHLLRLDHYTRWGLILAGALGSYSLGANNIGNVMGVFIPSSTFTDLRFGDLFTLTSVQQLFLLGAIAIGVGVFTYSKRVMMTVGVDIMPLTPLGAWVVVVSHSIVLFVFSSTAMEHFLLRHGLPAVPLIPVSSSQAVVGAVIGVGIVKGLKGVQQVQWRTIFKIASGWISTPLIAAVVCYVMLFFVQNVFLEPVYRDVFYELSPQVVERLEEAGVETRPFDELKGRRIAKGLVFREEVRQRVRLTPEEESLVISSAEVHPLFLDPAKVGELSRQNLTSTQFDALVALSGRSFRHRWQLRDALAQQTSDWEARENDPLGKGHNQLLEERLEYVYLTFRAVDASS